MKEFSRFIKDLVYLGLESFGKYYSIYQAFVADVEDPENLNRLRLIIPQVSGTNVYDYWALPKGVYSGQGYGVQLLPQKGDVVWVEFQGGHCSRPVWSHGWRGANELPNEPDVTDKNCIWLTTPKGIVIKLNDTKNYIHIKTRDGRYIEINGESVSMVSGNISLGKLNKSTYKAVKGEKAKEVLGDMKTFLDQFSEALNKSILESGTSSFLSKGALALAAPGLTQLASALGDKIEDTLSEIVTLE